MSRNRINFVTASALGWLLAVGLLAGCAAPADRLTLPAPVLRSPAGWFFDVHHRGRPDFALLWDQRGRVASVAYDDAGDGKWSRVYRLADYADRDVPHLIVLLDSIPYQAVVDRYRAGGLRMFGPPQKVIPPFPSLTEICFSQVLGCPPLPGMVDGFYDRDADGFSNTFWDRAVKGYLQPWERRVAYTLTMYQSGLAYLHPRPWYAAELARAKAAFDASPNHVTIVYFASASSMLSRYGKAGLDEVLDGIERMCDQILYERQGAVKITLMADHGHNLKDTTNISLAPVLEAAGFHIGDHLHNVNDVVLELHGLVTYTGVRTFRPAKAAAALCRCPQVNLATYMEGDRVIVRSAKGSAAIECRDGKLRYVPIDADVLGYGAVTAGLQARGKADAQGWADDDAWFLATLDHEYPDALRRLWKAFHGTVTHPPEVMVTLRDGYCAGDKSYEMFIHMASTHGSLNQVNSATFLMSMTGRVHEPLRSREVLGVVEPGFVPQAR